MFFIGDFIIVVGGTNVVEFIDFWFWFLVEWVIVVNLEVIVVVCEMDCKVFFVGERVGWLGIMVV